MKRSQPFRPLAAGIGIAAGIAAGLVVHFWRQFSVEGTVIIGLAVAALVYSAFLTADRLRSIWRR